mmetsp:Transcript_21105/g.32721  ORF Transcript_21105/g.32721 Transcript_21105/m.32721 type:complete len:207 (-) Transcript_21105:62-682(-)
MRDFLLDELGRFSILEINLSLVNFDGIGSHIHLLLGRLGLLGNELVSGIFVLDLAHVSLVQGLLSISRRLFKLLGSSILGLRSLGLLEVLHKVLHLLGSSLQVSFSGLQFSSSSGLRGLVLSVGGLLRLDLTVGFVDDVNGVSSFGVAVGEVLSLMVLLVMLVALSSLKIESGLQVEVGTLHDFVGSLHEVLFFELLDVLLLNTRS